MINNAFYTSLFLSFNTLPHITFMKFLDISMYSVNYVPIQFKSCVNTKDNSNTCEIQKSQHKILTLLKLLIISF